MTRSRLERMALVESLALVLGLVAVAVLCWLDVVP